MQLGQELSRAGKGVLPLPGPGGVGGCAAERDLHVRRAHATYLEGCSRRLGHQRELRVEHPRAAGEDGFEAVLRVETLLPLVEDEDRFEAALLPRRAFEQREHHGVAGLHVGGAPAVDPVSLDPDLDAALGLGDSVEVAGEDDPGERRVWLFAADGQVVRDALYLPALRGRDAGLQVVAETLLRSRNARTIQEEEESFE